MNIYEILDGKDLSKEVIQTNIAKKIAEEGSLELDLNLELQKAILSELTPLQRIRILGKIKKISLDNEGYKINERLKINRVTIFNILDSISEHMIKKEQNRRLEEIEYLEDRYNFKW